MYRAVICGVLALSACTGPGLLTDGSSVSHGTTSTGALRDGTVLPLSGEGYFMPRRWKQRRRNYGTSELVGLLIRAARRVRQQHRGSLLSIADLSPLGGGPTLEHKSHRSGRDADLLFYHLDEAGKPARATAMIVFDDQGRSVGPTSRPSPAPPTPTTQPAETPSSLPAEPTPTRTLDVERNWALVKAMVVDPTVSVQWIFIGRPAARLLLQHARRRREPAYIVERAAAVMHHQPAHMDHIHVRVFCAPSDRRLGCMYRGPSRWLKKDIKYLDSPPPARSTLPRNWLSRLGLQHLRPGRF